MEKKIIKTIAALIGLVIVGYTSMFFVSPATLVDVYRGDDEKTIWIKTKHLPIKTIISNTSEYKAPEVLWSPDKKHVSYLDRVEEDTYNKVWALKIFDPRILKNKTIFVGNWKTSRHKWVDKRTVRTYVTAGSGVRIYKDTDINVAKPFIAIDHVSEGYFTPEKTF